MFSNGDIVEFQGKTSDYLHVCIYNSDVNYWIGITFVDGTCIEPIEGLTCIRYQQESLGRASNRRIKTLLKVLKNQSLNIE